MHQTSPLRLRLLLFFALSLISTCRLNAGELPALSPNKNLWFSIQFGPAYTRQITFSSFYGGFALEYARNTALYSAQYTGVFAMFSYPNVKDNFKKFNSINLQYGRIHRYPPFKITYSAGLSFIMFPLEIKTGDIVIEKTDFTFGLPLSLQLLFTPIRILAVGLKAFVNFNRYNPYIGTSVGFYFGKVK